MFCVPEDVLHQRKNDTIHTVSQTHDEYPTTSWVFIRAL